MEKSRDANEVGTYRPISQQMRCLEAAACVCLCRQDLVQVSKSGPLFTVVYCCRVSGTGLRGCHTGVNHRRETLLSTQSAHCLPHRLRLQQNQAVAVHAGDSAACRGKVRLQTLQRRSATVYFKPPNHI